MGQSIDLLAFSSRVHNALRRVGINTLGDLCALPPDRRIALRNVGAKGIMEVETKLRLLSDALSRM